MFLIAQLIVVGFWCKGVLAVFFVHILPMTAQPPAAPVCTGGEVLGPTLGLRPLPDIRLSNSGDGGLLNDAMSPPPHSAMPLSHPVRRPPEANRPPSLVPPSSRSDVVASGAAESPSRPQATFPSITWAQSRFAIHVCLAVHNAEQVSVVVSESGTVIMINYTATGPANDASGSPMQQHARSPNYMTTSSSAAALRRAQRLTLQPFAAVAAPRIAPSVGLQHVRVVFPKVKKGAWERLTRRPTRDVRFFVAYDWDLNALLERMDDEIAIRSSEETTEEEEREGEENRTPGLPTRPLVVNAHAAVSSDVEAHRGTGDVDGKTVSAKSGDPTSSRRAPTSAAANLHRVADPSRNDTPPPTYERRTRRGSSRADQSGLVFARSEASRRIALACLLFASCVISSFGTYVVTAYGSRERTAALFAQGWRFLSTDVVQFCVAVIRALTLPAAPRPEVS